MTCCRAVVTLVYESLTCRLRILSDGLAVSFTRPFGLTVVVIEWLRYDRSDMSLALEASNIASSECSSKLDLKSVKVSMCDAISISSCPDKIPPRLALRTWSEISLKFPRPKLETLLRMNLPSDVSLIRV